MIFQPIVSNRPVRSASLRAKDRGQERSTMGGRSSGSKLTGSMYTLTFGSSESTRNRTAPESETSGFSRNRTGTKSDHSPAARTARSPPTAISIPAPDRRNRSGTSTSGCPAGGPGAVKSRGPRSTLSAVPSVNRSG